MAEIPKEFYTTKELAEYLHVSLRTVIRIIDRGEISYYEIGKNKRFRTSDIEAYLERQKRDAKA
jgi:excisionase family DNA binding protein